MDHEIELLNRADLGDELTARAEKIETLANVVADERAAALLRAEAAELRRRAAALREKVSGDPS